MLKRLLIGIFSLALLAVPVQGAGTIPLSLTQQNDAQGKPLAGCKLYTIQAGTVSTPQSSYQDSALTILWSNPLICDAYGRLPQFFLADGSIKVRLADKNGNTVFTQDGILVVGASSGGGGGSPVDPTTIFQTGDVMWLDVDGTRSGWVRDNGRTIGSATSGATERANADTQALYEFLWNTYSNTICPVSGGRGVSANADWVANKPIGTPNKQGLVPGGTDGMGGSATSVWGGVLVVSGAVGTAGSVVGQLTTALSTGNLPPQTPAGSISGGTYGFGASGVANANWSASGASRTVSSLVGYGLGNLDNVLQSPQSNPTFTGTAFAGQISTPFYNPQRTVLGSFYRKL